MGRVRLLNVDEEVPSLLWIVVGTNPVTVHNLTVTGGFSSAGVMHAATSTKNAIRYLEGDLDQLPFVPNPDVIPGTSMFAMSTMAPYRVEYNAEMSRRGDRASRRYPSRMSCIYAFGDVNSLRKACDLYGWDRAAARQFRIVHGPFTRVVKANMEIVSLMRAAETISSFGPDEQAAIWHHYWCGGASLTLEMPGPAFMPRPVESGVIWEYLVEGRVELVSP